MSNKKNNIKGGTKNPDKSKLEAENKRLYQENRQLARQAKDIALANAHAAELMVQLEEANGHLEAEIEKRKKAEQKLQKLNREIEAKIQRRTAELTTANERLTDEINKREQVEHNLREHKQRLDIILSTLLTGVVIVDSETHEIVDVNPLAAKMIGLPKEQITGKVCHAFICPAEEGKCPISDLGQTVDNSERILLRPAGQSAPILKNVTKAFWQGREYLIESFIDITDRKKAEEKVRQQNEFLNTVLESLTHPFYVVDANDYTIKMANSASYSGELSEKTTCYMLTHKRDEPCHGSDDPCPITEIKETKRAVVTEHVHYDQEGNLRNVEVHAYPIFDDEGNVSEIIEYTFDITQRRQAEEELRQINEKLADSNKQLQEFIYVASHDLKEPLRKVSAFGDMLKDALSGKLSDDELENFDFMIEGTGRMQQLVESLLAYSKVITKDIVFKDVDLNIVIDHLKSLELLKCIEETRGTLLIPDALPVVQCDPTQIRLLLLNLIKNALKYHGNDIPPIITIRAYSQADDKIRVEVEDNGIGIKREQCANIFVLFRRMHSEQEYEGTGIGLTLCKRIVEKHGGTIGVDSVYGRGSTFWFTLPVLKTLKKKQKEFSNNCPATCS